MTSSEFHRVDPHHILVFFRSLLFRKHPKLDFFLAFVSSAVLLCAISLLILVPCIVIHIVVQYRIIRFQSTVTI